LCIEGRHARYYTRRAKPHEWVACWQVAYNIPFTVINRAFLPNSKLQYNAR
jgi:hypothetical protein